MKSFVDYVARAHSWYKHLPLAPPGTPFCFFLDPNAGLDRVIEFFGATRYRYRAKQGFHYSDIPTAEYRQRYGNLQYSAEAGTTLLVPRATNTLWVSSDRSPTFGEQSQGPTVYSAEHGQVSVPVEILEAGCVELTGIIHPVASSTWFWEWPHSERAGPTWPEETGGPETVLKILSVVRDKRPNQSAGVTVVDGEPVIGYHPEIHRLVDPERQRLKKLMEDAILRVSHLVYG